METDAGKFYASYIKEYHEVRANYLNLLLSEIDDLNKHLKKKEISKENINVPLTKNTRFIIQADLRQNYFHCIETFFEFFFAFLPNNNQAPDNSKIVRQLVQAKWRNHPKKIEQIAQGKMKLNFLDQKIDFIGHQISIGHYMFYPGTMLKEKFGENWYSMVHESVKNIKKVIRALAIDFCERDEYNAYKHTMRIFPNFESLQVLDANTKEERINFDLSNSISFQVYNDDKKETTLVTKTFDPERDFDMTKLCSRLIYNMIELRNVMFNSEKMGNGDKKVAILLFNENNIKESSKHNIEIQNISFSTKLVQKGNS
ncbi:hypothetical protein V5739_05505 [Salinimicrobium sp. TIG7-5_MAKvit]|uniref:hypothetical protein n=1 Tax=Salinimicrobium sp. TIG7-5_MAKvit TaxID=3121289 RepID=UPI003C6DCBC3